MLFSAAKARGAVSRRLPRGVRGPYGTPRRVGGLEATSVGGRFSSRGRRSSASRKTQSGCVAEPPLAARPSRLADVGFCNAKAGNSQEPLGAEAQPPRQPHTAHVSVAASRHLHKLHGYERRLAAIGGELRRIRAPVCRVMEEAGALLKKSSTWRGPPV